MHLKVIVVVFLCVVHLKSASSACSGVGTFLSAEDTTCRKYYKCISYGGSILLSNYSCPSYKVFNPTRLICDAGATCIQGLCDGVDLSPGDTIPDPNATNCTTYIQCDGNKQPTIQICPAGTFYNDPYSRCLSTGDCSA